MKDERLKILFSMPNPSLHGGPAQHLPLLLDGLRDRCDLWTFEFGRKKDTEKIWQKMSGRLLDLIRLSLAITAFEPDLIHHNSAFDKKSIIRDAPLTWLSRSRKVPLLIKVHGSHKEAFGNMGPLTNRLRNYILNKADSICVLSELEMRDFEDKWPGCKGRIKVVKNIINPEFYGVARNESRTPTVLFISRFIKMKGIFDLLDAIPGVLAEVPDAEFIFIGSGPDSREFEQAVADRKLNAAVSHLQHIDNQETRRHYESAWCLAFPTRYPEGMPMVVAEAMAAGCPVVTSRTRFSLSYMTDGTHCLLAGPGQPELLARQIIRLLKDKGLREKISANSKEMAKQFTSHEVTSEFCSIYDGMTIDKYQ
jgi:glycosyltransferase involved in cell wall biosynthesis